VLVSRRPVLSLVLLALVLAALGAGSAPAVSAGAAFPDEIALPAGFQPEGISTGRGTTFYVGSLADGAIYRGDLRTGEGAVINPGLGTPSVGTEVDRRDRLWVAGGPSGTGQVYDARSGALLEELTFTTAASFVNDVVVTRRAAYFTDSVNPVLYRVPIGPGGRIGTDVATVPYSGDLEYVPGFNANGIEASPDGRTLLVVQSNTGFLFAVDAATGGTTQVDLAGAQVDNGDGLLRSGRTLYVVRNQDEQIDVVRLSAGYRNGTVTGSITDDRFDVPTTVARFGSALYAVNARFGSSTPEADDDVVRLPRR
jgi:sugar lactone lactonase YvrE